MARNGRCPAVYPRPPLWRSNRRAREDYQTRYGPACERPLVEHEASPPAQPVRALDNAAKKPVLMTRIDDVQQCYLDARAGWPDLRGQLELQVMISPAGDVESSRVASGSFPVPEVVCCLRQVLRSLRFPAAPDGSRTSATYDFAFRP